MSVSLDSILKEQAAEISLEEGKEYTPKILTRIIKKSKHTPEHKKLQKKKRKNK